MAKFQRPAHVLALGYLSYIVIGTFLLAIPFSQETPITWIDNLFTSASAVSTTGLVTIDPGTSYSWFGEFIILCLFQLGGLGYMTASSFVILAASKKLSDQRLHILKSAFSLPKTIGITHLVRNIIVFTFVCELVGALALYPYLRSANVERPLWSALFHSVSAFCTAGFSLLPTSFEGFRDVTGVNIIIAALSYLGGVGFIVYTDVWSKIKNWQRRLTFTTRVILTVTLILSAFGTAAIYFIEPSLQNLPTKDRVLASFFQAMTASTTVGFNTIPISKLSLPVVMILYFLMFFGASPAGTGGGLKSTTLTALIAETWSHLRGYKTTSLMGHEIPGNRVRAASMSASVYGLVLGLGIFGLSLAMPKANFEWMVFEAISALGTVGLSMGLTSQLTVSGKWIIIGLMYVGRLGVVTFGLTFITQKIIQNGKIKPDDLAI